MSSILTLNLLMNQAKESIAFLDLKVSVKNRKIVTDLYVKSTDRHHYLHSCLLIQTTPNDL